MDRRFGPFHDRVELTAHEARVIARYDRQLSAGKRLATSSDLHPWLTLRARLLLVGLGWRRRTIWLLPLGTIGMALALPRSFLLAVACTVAVGIGMVAVAVDLVNWRRRRRTWWA